MIVTFCGYRDIVCSDMLTRQLKLVLYDPIMDGADAFLLGAAALSILWPPWPSVTHIQTYDQR